MNAQSAYQAEEDRLESAVKDIETQLKGIGPRYTGDDFTEQMLDQQREERKRRLEIATRKLIWTDRLSGGGLGSVQAALYWQAASARSGSDDLLVIVWRAPAASLFYSFSGGEAPVSYASPDGDIGGTVHLKRNLMVRREELLRLVDSFVRGQEDGAVTDEFLLFRLGESKDNKLRISSRRFSRSRIRLFARTKISHCSFRASRAREKRRWRCIGLRSCSISMRTASARSG